MKIIKIESKSLKAMPWKNGGGSTTELLIYPPHLTINDDFDWRLSVAEIKSSGPFSYFLGYDRIIMLLSGESMTITHSQQADHKLVTFAPYFFSGDVQTAGLLNSTPAKDFNIMVKRDKYFATISTLVMSQKNTIKREHQQFLWIWKGSCQIHLNNEIFKLDKLDGLFIEGDEKSQIEVESNDSTQLILVTIFRKD